MANNAEFKLKYTIESDNSKAKKDVQEVDTLISKLFGKKTASSGLQSSFKEVASEVSNIVSELTGDRLSGAASQVTSLANAFGAIPGPAGLAIGAVAGIGTAAVGAAAALFELTEKSSEYGESIYNAQVKTGLHATTLSAMQVAAKQSGIEFDQVTNSIQKFAQTVGQAAEGSDKAGKSLIALGLDPKQAADNLDESLDKVLKKIADAPTAVEKNTLAFQAFGKQGKELLPFIERFHGDLPELTAELEKMGVTIGDKDALAAHVFGEEMSLVTNQIEKTAIKIGFAFMPVFNEMATRLSNWVAKNQNEITEWADKFAFAFGRVITGAEVVVSKLETIWIGYRKFMESIGLGFVFAVPDTLNADYKADFSKHSHESAGYNPGVPTGDLPDVYGKTPKTKAPGADSNYKEMEKFFAAMGVTVTDAKRPEGSLIAGTDRLSKHGIGEAVDVRTRDKTADEVAAIIAKAIEHGYRIYDERLAKGQPHLHVETNTLKPSTFYGDPALYGGSQNLAALKALDESRRGKASGTNVLTAEAKRQTDEQAKANEETLAALKDGLDKEVALKESHYETMKVMLDRSVAEGVITEESATKAKEKLELDFFNFKLDKLNEEAANFEGNAKEESRIAQEQALLQETIEQTKAKNEAKRFAEEKKRNDERNKSWSDYVKLIEQANDEQAAANDKAAQEKYQEKLQRTVGSGQTPDAFSQLREQFVGNGNTAMIAGVDAMTQAFSQLGEAVGSAVQAFVLYGSAGASVRQVTAQILASIAQQAAVQAIYELAQGLAVLALAFFGVPNAGPSATAHFAAAAMYGTIAGVTAGLGRAVAGNSFNKSAGGSGGKGKGTGSATATGAYSYNGNPDQNQHPTPYSRISDDAYISGSRHSEARFVADAIDRHAAVMERFEKKIDSMPAHAIVTKASQQRPGIIGNQAVHDVSKDSSIGTRFLKAAGQKR